MLDYFFFSSRRRHTRWPRDWSSDVCSSDLRLADAVLADENRHHAIEFEIEALLEDRQAERKRGTVLDPGSIEHDTPEIGRRQSGSAWPRHWQVPSRRRACTTARKRILSNLGRFCSSFSRTRYSNGQRHPRRRIALPSAKCHPAKHHRPPVAGR